MNKYFTFDYTAGAFVPFSRSHLIALGIIILINILLIVWLKKARNPQYEKIVRYGLAGLLILQEISLNVWRIVGHHWSAGSSLPLHLCGVAVILSAILLVTKDFRLYEIVYFWGFGGAVQALLTPDIGVFSFPHYRFFQFFVSHGSIVTASVFATFIMGFRPYPRSILKVFLITNVYMVLMAGFNYLVDGNYLFICHKPETASILDYLGPWPYYILSLEVVGLISFIIYYAPFFFRDRLVSLKAKN
ncbi:MAG: TIGR02206 family membrane protein [Candidatus Neomarinimicrobiota bacterium]